MNFKKVLLILFLVVCLIGAVNAAKNVNDFIVPSDYYPISNTFPDAAEGVYLQNNNNSGLVIMKYGEDDEDIAMYLDSNISYTENNDDTVYFYDPDVTYSRGIYEVFEVDGERFFADFWFSIAEDITEDEIYELVDKFNEDNNLNPISFSVPSSDSSSSSTDRYTNSIRILKATIVSGESQDDQTNCTVLIGKGYAGENVKISVLYSYDGENLNQGNIVNKTVSDSGKIKVPTLNGLTDFPDKAIITIYDSDGNKLDTKTVDLEQNSEPQTFKFYNDPDYASNGAKFVGYAGDGNWANYYKDGHYYTVDGEQID